MVGGEPPSARFYAAVQCASRGKSRGLRSAGPVSRGCRADVVSPVNAGHPDRLDSTFYGLKCGRNEAASRRSDMRAILFIVNAAARLAPNSDEPRM